MTTTKKPPTLSALADLPNINTKSESDISLKRIEHDIELERIALAELEKDREAALFVEGGDVVGISSSIVKARERIEILQAALVGVRARGVTIAQTEAATEIADWKADAKALAEQVTAETQKEVACLEQARAHAANVDRLRTQLDRKNTYLQDAGVPPNEINTFAKIQRLAKEGMAGPLNRNLSEHGKPLDIFLHDLALNVRIVFPLHMAGQRVGAVDIKK